MTGCISYLLKNSKHKNAFGFLRVAACVLLLLLSQKGFAKDDPDYDEISIFVTVQGVGSTEIPAVIREEVVYLSVADIFNFLKIKNSLSSDLDTLSGFLINPQSTFLFDRAKKRVVF